MRRISASFFFFKGILSLLVEAQLQTTVMFSKRLVTLRTDAPWDLGRVLSSRTKLTNQDSSVLTYTYKYDSTAGANYDVCLFGTFVE